MSSSDDPPVLYLPHPPSTKDLSAFFDRQEKLLGLEEAADQARTAALATNCSFDELGKRGLALNGLGVSGVTVGLGGKSLIALHRPSAFHTEPALPSHTFRPGDPASIVPQEAVRKDAKASSKKKDDDADGSSGPVEGVVYKVTETTITLAVSPRDGEDLELPERCRLIKMANSGTFDRMGKAVERVRRLLGVPMSQVTTAVTSLPDKTVEKKKEGESSGEEEEKTQVTPTPSLTGQEVAVIDATASLDASSPDLSPSLASPAEPAPILDGSPSAPETLSPPPTTLTSTSNHPSFPLLRTLFALDAPTSTPLVDGLTWFDDTLNDSQKLAVRYSLEADQVACIHGPPGTGKTFTLVEIIRQLVQTQKKRVLVCGASNLSVDNLLLRLSPLFPATSITRIGHPARILPSLLTRTLDYQTAHSNAAEVVKDVKKELEGHLDTLSKGRKEKGAVKGKKRYEVYGEVRELRKEFRVRESKVVRDVLGTTEIVLATCHTAGARQLAAMDFDVVIIDEATQALEAVCMIPILKANKLILAGDPNQLPPTIISDAGVRRSSTKKSKAAPKSSVRLNVAAGPKDIMSPTSTGAAPPSTDSTPSTPADNSDPDDLSSSESEPDEPPSTIHDTSSSSASTPRRTTLRPPSSLSLTLFSRLEHIYGPAIKRLLSTQYRMNSLIAQFPSDTLYESRLVSAPSVAERTLATLPGVEERADAGGNGDGDGGEEWLESPVVFLDTAGCEFYERGEDEEEEEGSKGKGKKGVRSKGRDEGGSKMNENEAECVRLYVLKLIALGVEPKEIGVLAAYQAQVSLLSSLLKPTHPDLLIGTVDSLQGQEREAIVLSLVRSNPKREVGFLADERRLNVAMTRAKRQLCVVGDSATVSNGSDYLKAWMDWLEENAEVRFAGDLDLS